GGPSPFPTLNIEVPDDIFPAMGLGAASSTGPLSSDPEPTRRLDGANKPVPRAPLPPGPPRPAAGVPAKPAIPVVVPGGERQDLTQTLQSEDSIPPPPPSEEEEEAPTVLKEPSEADKARMSLAEEAMAKALAKPPPPVIGQGLPKFSGPESVEPTLVAGKDHPQEKTHVSNTPPPIAKAPTPAPSPRPAINAHASSPQMSLKDLSSTIPLDPEQVEKAVLDAVRKGPASPPPGPPAVEGASLPLDKPARRPTSELIPVHLSDESGAAAAAGDAPKVDALPVWEPKGRKLSGPKALIVGIVIGAVLVVLFIGLLVLLRGQSAE
ncbi:MAG: hypothetical protein HOW73_35930, partial [Polyangiaceae bacterium]|nr:hypothetical protein [Polyangiaceae bacterium]